MRNPHQYNYTQQLEHRLSMVLDDLNILKKFIIQEDLGKVFETKNTATSDSAYCNINNIDIACDLSNDESLSWGVYKFDY
jgi:hypothetical protein